MRNLSDLKLMRSIMSHNLPLSSIEHKVLKTLIRINVGNAYTTWKASGLKHYPTVLRSLKKLENKGCIEVSTKGVRGEKQYVPSSLGMLVSLVLEEDLPKIKEFIANNSPKFQELVRANISNIDKLVFSVVQTMSYAWRPKTKVRRNIEEILEDEILDEISPEILSIQEEGSRNTIIEMAKVPWVRELVLREIEYNIDWSEKQVKELRKLKEILTTK